MAYDAGKSEDYLSDSDSTSAEPTADKAGGEPSADEETAILPKSILGGKEYKPGDEISLKIVRFHDDSVEVCPCGDNEEAEEGEAPMEEAPMPEAGGGGDAEMAGMMQ